MKNQHQQGPGLTASVSPEAKTSGTKLPTPKGNLLVSFQGIFFIMSHLSHYVPWSDTIVDGTLITAAMYEVMKDDIGPDKIMDLTPFQEKRAAIIAENLKKDPLYKLSDEQRDSAIRMINLKREAHYEGITVGELLHRKEIRAQRAAKRERQQQNDNSVSPSVKTTTKEGVTHFSLGNLKILEALRRTVQYT